MSKARPSKTGASAADRLYAAFEEVSTENLETLRAALQLEGINLEKLNSRATDLIIRLSRQRELLDAKAKLEGIREALRRLGLGSREVIGDLRERLSGMPEAGELAQLGLARYRKLESMTPEDLESLKDDRNLLAFLVESETGEDTE